MSSEDLRIGVFICHCGTNIAGAVDVPKVVEFASKIPGVVHAENNLYTCSSDGIAKIQDAIKEHRLNRVVVASCTPRTHEPLFMNTCEEAGLNKYLFQMANIREHCSWVHSHEPEEATEKANEIVAMAVAKARYLEPQTEAEIEIQPSTLVIGGGVAGMTVAVSVAQQGFDVHLVEKDKELGGMLKKLNKLFPGDRDAQDVLQEMKKTVESIDRINVLTSTTVKDVSGFIGNFDVRLMGNGEEEKELKVGTIVVATGADYFEPVGMYGYGEHSNIVTQLQLEDKLRSGTLGTPQRVVMIQCVGAREAEGRSYCSRICCTEALKNALLIKEQSPPTDVYFLYRDVQTYGVEYENYQWMARERGVRFVRYLQDKPPSVEFRPGERTRVKVYHALLGEDIELDADLVVLSTPLIPAQGSKDLSQLLKVPLDAHGFFLEAHVKLRPVDFATDGIFVCGTAHSPKDVAESVSQAYAAASRASIPMFKGKVKTPAITAAVDKELCVGCRLCEDLCRFGAHVIEDGKSRVIEALCKGCGVCAAGCPQHAITMKHFQDKQIMAEIVAAFAR